jgi:hypothetical protein
MNRTCGFIFRFITSIVQCHFGIKFRCSMEQTNLLIDDVRAHKDSLSTATADCSCMHTLINE